MTAAAHDVEYFPISANEHNHRWNGDVIDLLPSTNGLLFTGIDPRGIAQNGQEVIICNTSDGYTITLSHNSASSADGNRFFFNNASNVILGPGDQIFGVRRENMPNKIGWWFGPIQGPTGPQGLQGTAGPQGIAGQSSIGSVTLATSVSTISVATLTDILTLNITTTSATSKVLILAPVRYTVTLAALLTLNLTVDGVLYDITQVNLGAASSGANNLTTLVILSPGAHVIKVRASIPAGVITFAANVNSIYAQALQ